MPDEIMIESQSKLSEIKTHSQEMAAANAERDADFAKYNNAYLMEWPRAEDPRFKDKFIVQSPDARNQIEGAIRLMIATDPQWKVVDTKTGKDLDNIEKALGSMWDAAGRAAKTPIHYDLIRSALLYAQIDAAITPTAELLAYARKTNSKAQIAAAEDLAESTPYLIEPWNPSTGYPEWDALGLGAYYRCQNMTIGQIEARYGKIPNLDSKVSRRDITTLHVYYDREYCAIWCKEADIICKPHDYSTIPIVSQLIDGSRLFSEPEHQHQPLLYGAVRSGVWDAQSLMLTVIFSTALTQGSVGKFVYIAPPGAQDDQGPEFGWEEDVIPIRNGAQFAPLLNKGLIDESLTTALQMAQIKGQESTIYPQAFGAPADRGMTFSEANLLAQSGRLPLIGTQRKGGWAIGEIGKVMLTLAKDHPEYLASVDLQASDIPARFQVEAVLDVKLPQDKLQLANIARLLTQGDNPLVSNDWARENILQIGQPEDVQKQVIKQQAIMLRAARRLQELQAQDQPQPQPQPGQGMPPQGQPTRPMPAGPMMAEGQAQAIQGMPPQMAGVMPGAGQGMADNMDMMTGGMNG